MTDSAKICFSAEAANNADAQCKFIPMLTLGIFVTRPISLAFIIATAVLLVVMVLPAVWAGRDDITG